MTFADLCDCSVNDRTVPYVTSAIELEDPFLNPDENGIVPYVFCSQHQLPSLTDRFSCQVVQRKV